MAHGPVVKEEGSSDLIPIRFGDPFSVEKMDHLLGWFYREKLDRELNVKELADILELGTFLDMHCARVTAIEQLSRISNFPPALKLSLALSFHVSEWIEPAFRQLLKTDAGSLTYGDFIILGPYMTHILMTTQFAIHHYRSSLAFHPYRLVHQTGCHSPGLEYSVCQKKWSNEWKQGFTPLYLHPDAPLSPEEAMQKLAAAPMPGVTPACCNAAISHIIELGVFEKENEMAKEALKKVQFFVGTKWYQKL
ncbi:hypothetical protein M422DRAFT_264536 [Sphaerobolus stellatus SS14]|uniref:BTB domain-containing protein n=1 Tax=Sphaerobolus stellatus (strain SS14) TaxID=990650 RepID=A0A0C9UW18_SPHS4|nr:hypothetical protein M422DRAFT_264536 [Sphaerobolus stellatus SS14]